MRKDGKCDECGKQLDMMYPGAPRNDKTLYQGGHGGRPTMQSSQRDIGMLWCGGCWRACPDELPDAGFNDRYPRCSKCGDVFPLEQRAEALEHEVCNDCYDGTPSVPTYLVTEDNEPVYCEDCDEALTEKEQEEGDICNSCYGETAAGIVPAPRLEKPWWWKHQPMPAEAVALALKWWDIAAVRNEMAYLDRLSPGARDSQLRLPGDLSCIIAMQCYIDNHFLPREAAAELKRRLNTYSDTWD